MASHLLFNGSCMCTMVEVVERSVASSAGMTVQSRFNAQTRLEFNEEAREEAIDFSSFGGFGERGQADGLMLHIELGTACGKLFRCSTMVILDSGDSDILVGHQSKARTKK